MSTYSDGIYDTSPPAARAPPTYEDSQRASGSQGSYTVSGPKSTTSKDYHGKYDQLGNTAAPEYGQSSRTSRPWYNDPRSFSPPNGYQRTDYTGSMPHGGRTGHWGVQNPYFPHDKPSRSWGRNDTYPWRGDLSSLPGSYRNQAMTSADAERERQDDATAESFRKYMESKSNLSGADSTTQSNTAPAATTSPSAMGKAEDESDWEGWTPADLSKAAIILGTGASIATGLYGTYRLVSAANSTSFIGLPFLPLKLAGQATGKLASTAGWMAYNGVKAGTKVGWAGTKLGARLGYGTLKTGMSVGEGLAGMWTGNR